MVNTRISTKEEKDDVNIMKINIIQNKLIIVSKHFKHFLGLFLS